MDAQTRLKKFLGYLERLVENLVKYGLSDPVG